MSDGYAYLDIIFFAMVAAFIALRLRSVLGRRTGNERRRPDPYAPPAQRKPDNVVPIPERPTPQAPADDAGIADTGDARLKGGLTALRLADRNFNLEGFLEGSKAAFGMIVDAFARGDKDGLRPLLASDVFLRFTADIDDRARRGEVLSTDLVSEPKAELVEVEMLGSRAQVTVRFDSQQVNVVRDLQGNVVSGDPNQTESIVDLWTFERDTRSRDPNWQLVETRTPS